MRAGTHRPRLRPLSRKDQLGTREGSQRQQDSLEFAFFWSTGALNALPFPTRAGWETHNQYPVYEQ